jgi:hypothetical protein
MVPPEPTRPHVGRRIVHVLPPLLAQPVVARVAALAPQAAVRRLGNHLGYVWGYVQWEIFRILKWRYVSTIFLAIFCGDIHQHRPEK